MKQIEIFEITSPCIGVCQSGPSGYCLGCFRSRDERLHWIKLEQDVQSKIIKVCAVRKKRFLANKQKPSTELDQPLQNDLFD
ncbi:DUF1289 domain-containing protein [Paraglaciecola sp.]|uniref:DUF1289 domain-containing protein n=1 Tax=Paraglaciecola sp. TaxID=1920173 RepID=UPI0030F3DC43